MHSLCVVVVESHVTIKYTVLHNNAFMVNLCHLQQYKLYIRLLQKIIFQLICTLFAVTYIHSFISHSIDLIQMWN